jgi:hypothetical protein
MKTGIAERVARLTGLSIFLIVSFTQAFGSNQFRCGRAEIVHVGDSTAKVRAQCGPPEYRDRQVLGGGAEHRVEVWVYRDYHARKWMTELRFRNGRLHEIESLGKVD